MFQIILITAVVGVLGLGLGGVIGATLGEISKKAKAIILSFSAGTMIALICLELVHEAIEAGLSVFWIAFIVLLSSGIVCVLDYLVDSRAGHVDDFTDCEQCDEKGLSPNKLNTKMRSQSLNKKRSEKMQLMIAGLMTAAAVAIHNVPEGMSVGALYAREGGLTSAFLVLIGTIILHNIPEGMAIAISLTTSGMKKAKAIGVAALSGAPTIIGAAIGYAMGSSEGSFGPAIALSFAAGTLSYVTFGEILPQSIKLYSSRKTAYSAIVGLAVGLMIIGSHVH